MPKLSKYNQFQPWLNGYYIAYNARSGAVALMTEDNYAVYNRLSVKLAAESEPALNEGERELLTQLEYGKFACETDFDELNAVKFRHRLDRHSLTALGLVIAPTMACNMACTYCFENKYAGLMSAEVRDALAHLVERQAQHLTSLDVSWYGGEPLLAMDVIEELSIRFLKLGEERGFTYKATMISNGYLLTDEVVDRLVKCRVETVQITLDGPARIHNAKRPLKNGRESFDTIVENIARAISRIAVTVRVNVDRSFTREMVAELLGELVRHGLQDKITLYFGQLEPATSVCSNIAESCFETGDFAAVEVDFHRLLLEYGFQIGKLPSPVSTICVAQVVNSFLVDPNGDLYKCFNYIGDKSKSMGRITESINFQHPNFVRLFAFDPFEHRECVECGLLPICMGGCPARRADRGLAGEASCESWRHNLSPMLDIIARSKQQERQRPQAAAKESI